MTHVIAPIAAAATDELFALARSAVDDGADLLEIRLDTCIEQGVDAQAVLAIISDMPAPVVLACRHAQEERQLVRR